MATIETQEATVERDAGGDLTDVNEYHFVQALGRGAFAEVSLCVDAASRSWPRGARRFAAAPNMRLASRAPVSATELDSAAGRFGPASLIRTTPTQPRSLIEMGAA